MTNPDNLRVGQGVAPKFSNEVNKQYKFYVLDNIKFFFDKSVKLC